MIQYLAHFLQLTLLSRMTSTNEKIDLNCRIYNIRFHIMTTRFNRKTWGENVDFCNQHNIRGSLYGSRVRVSDTIGYRDYMFVLEMLNIPRGHRGYPGKIMGIGLVQNRPVHNKSYNIYSNTNYNRFCYKSKYRVDRNMMNENDLTILHYLEDIVFRGYTHMKRGCGITRIPSVRFKKHKKRIMTFLCALFCNSSCVVT